MKLKPHSLPQNFSKADLTSNYIIMLFAMALLWEKKCAVGNFTSSFVQRSVGFPWDRQLGPGEYMYT